MSMRYKGATLSSTAPVTTGGESGTAPGAWTLEQQAQAQAAGLWPIPLVPKYVEDVFSTYLYTGNGSTQTITNGIDLAGKGGLVWAKTCNFASSHALFDTVRGGSSLIGSNSTNAAYTGSTYINPFNSNGFTWAFGDNQINGLSRNYVSWTFREQPKFFDVVTYTGNGVSGRLIPHNLGSTPGFVVVKNITNANSWYCWHRSLPNSGGFLETTDAFSPGLKYICGTVNDTVFSVDSAGGSVNGSGENYVAYIFAHNAGGFGLTGTDNVISCGSFTVDGSGNASVNLGYEPQYVLYKRANLAGLWYIDDTMRGLYAPNTAGNNLFANLSNAESVGNGSLFLNSTGFTNNPSGNYASGDTVIYIAIRRGPMKVPTLGTSVFAPIFPSAASGTQMTTGFPVDMQLLTYTPGGYGPYAIDRLRGVITTPTDASSPYLKTNTTAAEVSNDFITRYWNNTGFQGSSFWGGSSTVFHNFRRAPGFFDEVCYTGTGSATTFAHNLGVVPELMIVKNRVTGTNWAVYTSALGATQTLFLNLTNTPSTVTSAWNDTAPTASVFAVGSAAATNTSTNTYVNYLFATCAGVSKVGSYTGTGTTQTINCGFTAGARFVLIKRTDSTGDWYVWDSARGIVAGNDPYILLNSVAAEVTGTDYVDTAATGFEISSTAPAAINASGGSFVFLAIA